MAGDSESYTTALTELSIPSSVPFGARIEDYSSGEIAIVARVLGGLAFCGMTINGAVLYMFITKKSLHTPMNALFVSLTVCDFLVSVCASFVSFIHVTSKTKMSDSICSLYGVVSYTAGTSVTVVSSNITALLPRSRSLCVNFDDWNGLQEWLTSTRCQ